MLLAVTLFLLTFASTTLAGQGFGLTVEMTKGWGASDFLLNGLKFSGPLMAILTAHELGHYLFARYYGVRTTPPYFIPLPFAPISLFGTMGAVMFMRERIRVKHQLFDIGAAGPLAGFVVALPCVFIGVALSDVQPFDPSGEAISEGNNLLYWLAKRWLVGPLPPFHDINTHPVAWAGWLGLLVTALNMMPVGQLDGGHIAYALFGRSAQWLSRGFHLVLWFMGLTGVLAWGAEYFGLVENVGSLHYLSMWAFWALILRMTGARHPPVDDERMPLSAGRVALGWLCFLIGVISFIPIPIQLTPREPLNPARAEKWRAERAPPVLEEAAPGDDTAGGLEALLPGGPATAQPQALGGGTASGTMQVVPVTYLGASGANAGAPLRLVVERLDVGQWSDGAVKAMRQARAGATLAEVATALAADTHAPSTPTAQTLTLVGPLAAPAALRGLLSEPAPGSVRGPVRTQDGWSVVRIVSVEPLGGGKDEGGPVVDTIGDSGGSDTAGDGGATDGTGAP
jgi:membrane-associated protease RseP (regulator of RpoE activity)